MNRDNRAPHYFSAHFPGGAAHSIYSIVHAAHIEQQSGLYLRDLFTGGCRAGSAGVFPAVAAFMPNKADPTKPLYSMTEFIDVFANKISEFLPYSPFHHGKHALNHFTPLSKGLFNLHMSPKPMEDGLKEMLGGLTLKDATRTFSVTSQEISPNLRPHDFTFVEDNYLGASAKEILDYPIQDLPLYKILMAATRFPTVFDSYTLDETGTTHIDMAFVDGSADFISRCLRHRKEGQHFAHVIFGTTVDTQAISPEEYRGLDALSMLFNRFFIKGAGIQTKGRNLESLRGLLGSRNFYLLEDSLLPEDNPKGTVMPSLNILDTRPETMRKHIEFAKEQLERHADTIYKPLVDRLVENHALITQVQPDTAFTVIEKATDSVADRLQRQADKIAEKVVPEPRTTKFRFCGMEVGISFNRVARNKPADVQDNEPSAQLTENKLEQDAPEETRTTVPEKKHRAP